MLLLYDHPSDFQDFSPEEMQKIIQRYTAWGDKLRAEGRLVDSHKLTDGEGRVLRRSGGDVRIVDGPFSETKEVIGGYFTVSAASYDEAVEIARGCPHLDYSGVLEIREVEMH
jgi:hypothetical protein